jgi:hypothetical protein
MVKPTQYNAQYIIYCAFIYIITNEKVAEIELLGTNDVLIIHYTQLSS